MMAQLLLVVLATATTASFAFAPTPFVPYKTALYLYNDQNEEPFFRMQQIPTATTGSRLDHVVECAENGECDVTEMMAMIDGEFVMLTSISFLSPASPILGTNALFCFLHLIAYRIGSSQCRVRRDDEP